MDDFLEQIRSSNDLSHSAAMEQPRYVNFVRLLAFYVGEVISRANGRPVEWGLWPQCEPEVTPFGVLAVASDGVANLVCMVQLDDGSSPLPFFPMHSIMSRLFEAGMDKSVWLSAGLVMRQPVNPEHAGKPLAPLLPVYLPLNSAPPGVRWLPEQVTQLRITAPSWMDVDPLQRLISAELALIQEGHVVWGAYVQANNFMLQPVWHGGGCGEVVFDPLGMVSPEDLEEIAEAIYQLKSSTEIQVDQQEMVAHLMSGSERVMAMPVPPSICSYPLFLSSTYFDQMHLPDGVLTLRCFPILIHPDHKGVVKLLPYALWTERLVDSWMEHSLARFGKRVPVPQLRSEASSAAVDVDTAFRTALALYRGDAATPADPGQAFALFAKNAARGHAKSMVWAGDLLVRGAGVERDPRLAFQWYLVAAKAGDVDAMVKVAENHLRLDGIEPNLMKGEAWLEKAASLGSRRARTLLDQAERDANASKGILGKLWDRMKR